MAEEIIIIGAGGLGKEVVFLVQRLSNYQILGFIDDNIEPGTIVCGYPILGDLKMLLERKHSINIVIAIASPQIRKRIVKQLESNPNYFYPTLIDPTALTGVNIILGKGNILMANTTYTADIELGDFNLVNIGSTMGHDLTMGSYNNIFPGCNISGNVSIGDANQFGTGTKIIPGIQIEDEVIAGAGAVIIRNFGSQCTVVGVPAMKIIRKEDK